MLMGNVRIMEMGRFLTRLILYANIILCMIAVKSTKTLKCDTRVPVSPAEFFFNLLYMTYSNIGCYSK